MEAANLDHNGPLLTHAVVPFFCDEGEHRRDADRFHTASHDGQGRSSREPPNGDDDPFSFHDATEQVAYPLHPPIFVAQ